MNKNINIAETTSQLNECVRIAMITLDDLNIPYKKPDYVRINTRYTSRWGSCRSVGNGHFVIEISALLFDKRNDNFIGAMNTIIHELIHTCHGCFNHGKTWKKYAEIVSENTQYKIKRTNNSSEKMLAEEVINEEKEERLKKRANHIRYVVCCKNCKREYIYKRKCMATEHPTYYRCVCGSSRLYCTHILKGELK